LGEILFVGLYEQTLDQPYGDGVGTGAEIKQMCKCVRGTHAILLSSPHKSTSVYVAPIKDIFTAGDAAVDVIDRSRKKQAGASRHEKSPMRGRDNPILLRRWQKSTSVEVCTWHPSSWAVNLRRVREIRPAPNGGWEVKLDPPVNRVLPVSRRRISALWERFGE
jgi:hypothetical protein